MAGGLVATALVAGGLMLAPKEDPKVRLTPAQLQNPASAGIDGRVDRYESPEGKGYQITEEKEEDGMIYRRSYGEGPESSWRSYDWREARPARSATST